MSGWKSIPAVPIPVLAIAIELATDASWRAYELDPHQLYSAVTMGAISAALGSADDAARYYSEVIELTNTAIAADAADYWTYFTLGEARVFLGEEDQAREAYGSALSLDPPPADIRSASESLGFLADHDIAPAAARDLQEHVLLPATRLAD